MVAAAWTVTIRQCLVGLVCISAVRGENRVVKSAYDGAYSADNGAYGVVLGLTQNTVVGVRLVQVVEHVITGLSRRNRSMDKICPLPRTIILYIYLDPEPIGPISQNDCCVDHTLAHLVKRSGMHPVTVHDRTILYRWSLLLTNR